MEVHQLQCKQKYFGRWRLFCLLVGLAVVFIPSDIKAESPESLKPSVALLEPEWETWEPDFKKKPKFTRPATSTLHEFHRHFRTDYLTIWDYDSAPDFDGTRVVFPETVMDIISFR